jgi:hypothetical protein
VKWESKRKYPYWRVIIRYVDGEKFGRVYTNKDKAEKYAERQRRSPVVKSVTVDEVS